MSKTSSVIKTRSREWMVEIGKKRQYKNQARGFLSGRFKVHAWKKKIICAYESMPRALAESLAKAVNCSPGYIYQIRREAKDS